MAGFRSGERYRFKDEFGNVRDAIGRVRENVRVVAGRVITGRMVGGPRDLEDRLYAFSPQEDYAATKAVYGPLVTSQRLGDFAIAPNWKVAIGTFSGRGGTSSSGLSMKIDNPSKHLNLFRFGGIPHTISAKGDKPMRFALGHPLRWGVRHLKPDALTRAERRLMEMEDRGIYRKGTPWIEVAETRRAFRRVFGSGGPMWITVNEVNHPGPLMYRRTDGRLVRTGHMQLYPGLTATGDFVQAAIEAYVKSVVEGSRDLIPRILLPLRKAMPAEKRFDVSRWEYTETATISIIERLRSYSKR